MTRVPLHARSFVKASADRLHKLIARNRIVTRFYLEGTGWLCRNILPTRVVPYIMNLILGRGTNWPILEFSAMAVEVGSTRMLIHPHIGEFDQQVLFYRQLRYEEAVFRWLQKYIYRYDTIIEIGANVGIFTVYFGLNASNKAVYAFEPSSEAFNRLTRNLKSNPTAKVSAYNLAIGRETGFMPFFEPQGHLTNGSFLRPFSEHFSSSIREVKVPTLNASILESLMVGKVLIKIDVEGFEPDLLDAIGSLLERLTPDLLIEVLPGTDQYINQSGLLSFYDAFILSEKGGLKCNRVYADPRNRDWLLIPIHREQA